MLLVLVLMPFGGWGHRRLMRIISHKQDLPEEAVSYSRLMGKNFNPRMETIPLLSDEQLAALRMPVLLIAGEKDALLPSKVTAARLEMLLPDLTLDLVPDTGHLLIGFERRVMEFLGS
jgi:pimeloyl-ACP methyl ester carboxylesterase